MEHPGLSVPQLKEDLSLEEIQTKLREITERLNFAYHMQNQQLINQLEMVRETYQRAMTEMLQELFGNDKDDKSIDGKIDISS